MNSFEFVLSIGGVLSCGQLDEANITQMGSSTDSLFAPYNTLLDVVSVGGPAVNFADLPVLGANLDRTLAVPPLGCRSWLSYL